MLWKCCIQYVSKFGKLSNGHRTGKGQFSFQSQRKAMPKNAQTLAQLHLSCTSSTGGSEVKASASNSGNPSSVPGLDPWVGKIPWRRKWQCTPVFLPGESHGQTSLVGYSPWSRRVRHDWSDSAAAATYASKLMLKILQARLQLYVNHKLPDVQAGFRKGRGSKDQIANICWVIK